jgi:hypothetical protein
MNWTAKWDFKLATTLLSYIILAFPENGEVLEIKEPLWRLKSSCKSQKQYRKMRTGEDWSEMQEEHIWEYKGGGRFATV